VRGIVIRWSRNFKGFIFQIGLLVATVDVSNTNMNWKLKVLSFFDSEVVAVDETNLCGCERNENKLGRANKDSLVSRQNPVKHATLDTELLFCSQVAARKILSVNRVKSHHGIQISK
jgi:hypothetical protein